MRFPLIPTAVLAGLAIATLGVRSSATTRAAAFTCYGYNPPTWTATVQPTFTATATPTYTVTLVPPTVTATSTPPTATATWVPPTTTPPTTVTPPRPTFEGEADPADSPEATPANDPNVGTPTTTSTPRSPSGTMPGRGGSRPSGPTPPNAPTAPARPATAGTDWHQWWNPRRPQFWRARETGATVTPGHPSATDDAAAPAWLQALRERAGRSASWTDRAALAEGLACTRDPRLLEIALDLVADNNSEVRRLGVFAAASTMREKGMALPSLRAVLEDPSIDDHPRAAAAAALGALGDPAVRDVLWRTVRAPHESVIRIGAIIGLGYVADALSVRSLARILENRREDTPVRAAAAVALGQCCQTPALARLAGDALMDAIANPASLSAEIRQTVALNLGHADANPSVLRRVAELVQHESDARTRCCAAIAMGWLARHAPDARDVARRALVAEWDKEPPSVRGFLALGLGLARCETERRRLEGWLNGRGDPLHRGAAAIALGLLGDPAALPALAHAAVESPPGLRGDACEAMGLIGGPRAADALVTLASDGPAAQRGAALYALGCIGRRQDLGLIADHLRAPTPDLRIGAAYGLAAFGGDLARNTLLLHAAREADPQVRNTTLYGVALAMAPRPADAPGKDVDRSPWARAH